MKGGKTLVDERIVWVMNTNGSIFAAFDSRDKAKEFFENFLKKTYHFDDPKEREEAVEKLYYRGVYIIGVRVQ